MDENVYAEAYERAMRDWEASQKRLEAMDPVERVWLEGFVSALLYAQAHQDEPGGKQTLECHLPNEWFDTRIQQEGYTKPGKWVEFEDLEQKLKDIIWDLDDEGGILSVRFKTIERTYEFPGSEPASHTYEIRVIEIGSSEGHFGSPEWRDEIRG